MSSNSGSENASDGPPAAWDCRSPTIDVGGDLLGLGHVGQRVGEIAVEAARAVWPLVNGAVLHDLALSARHLVGRHQFYPYRFQRQ